MYIYVINNNKKKNSETISDVYPMFWCVHVHGVSVETPETTEASHHTANPMRFTTYGTDQISTEEENKLIYLGGCIICAPEGNSGRHRSESFRGPRSNLPQHRSNGIRCIPSGF